MYLNSANSKNNNPYYFTTNNTQLISIYEKQHLNYLDKMMTNENISSHIPYYTDGLNELSQHYTKEYLDNETALDIHDQIRLFNNTHSFNNMHFVDWFALQDYKHAGYVKINQTLRDNLHNATHYPAEIKQLYLTLMHQILLQSIPLKHEEILYRGEVRDINFTHRLNKGDVIKSHAFWSTSKNKETANSFCDDANSLTNDEFNIFYVIENNSPYSGASISQILRDSENEFLFLPQTEFNVIDTYRDEKNNIFNVRLETVPTTEYALTEKIHQIIFS
ncbi:TPA: ADP-ribosyltransferase domain-containing protein [Providencia alcalifaciens]|uniref:NAD(+)--protein-arginine ADP-ribosyltransferase n=2 Tax=Providencia alcalifaciens TaxID=126385 RepID=B6XIQ4_9GAMM|nr:ADP-ribosyltransferase domain-containing protein [Providencia alcalifaciens]ATG18153.1 hypothetical protein CO695_18255 [Providencia alcalifaciens]EEB44742.1 hypothetical protein PROVALCAL_03249 [Providencia alcalifaciens DSM 30120]CAG9414361.1 hypothetical protein NVI2019_NGLDDFDA_01111 [Providencia alcalifaciens]SQI33026.1 ADP-ribosyltransferase exoenzyme [Providencia alcalifaciens]